MEEEPLKTDCETKYFWEISTKGSPRYLIDEALASKIKYIIAPTDRGYFSIFLFCNEIDYRVMRAYILSIESKNDRFKTVGCRPLKKDDLDAFMKFKVFSKAFENEYNAIKNNINN